MKKENHEKLQKIVNITTFVFAVCFLVLEITLMILTSIDIVKPEDFLAQLNSLIAIFMIFVNICALVSYCRNAGNPYLNDKTKKYVRRFKFVVAIWNLAFVIKIFLNSLGITIVDLHDDTIDAKDDFWYSVESFSNIMFTEVLPFYFVIDSKLVKILIMDFCSNGRAT